MGLFGGPSAAKIVSKGTKTVGRITGIDAVMVQARQLAMDKDWHLGDASGEPFETARKPR